MGKVSTFAHVLKTTDEARKKGKTIVATNGCFDLLHVGHVRNLEHAKSQGDILVVGINSDASVRENKGDTRPIIPERERAEVIASLKSVDYVFIFSAKTPFSWIKKLRPHVHIKGSDVVNVPEFNDQRQAVEAGGGKFILAPLAKGRSTSAIVAKIQSLPKKKR